MPSLFDPIQLGPITCKNRIWMAPLTRGRATRDHVPTQIMAEYYAQRASAGLIITEATGISVEGSGWPYAGGIWGKEHTQHWRTITDAERTRFPRRLFTAIHLRFIRSAL